MPLEKKLGVEQFSINCDFFIKILKTKYLVYYEIGQVLSNKISRVSNFRVLFLSKKGRFEDFPKIPNPTARILIIFLFMWKWKLTNCVKYNPALWNNLNAANYIFSILLNLYKTMGLPPTRNVYQPPFRLSNQLIGFAF